MTVSAWVYSSDFSLTGTVMAKNTADTQWRLYFQSGTLRWRGAATENSTQCTAPSNDTWHHIVAIHDSVTNDGYLFINGAQCDTGKLTDFGNGTGTVDIGRHSGGTYFTGSIDEARVYNRKLLDAEVQLLYELYR